MSTENVPPHLRSTLEALAKDFDSRFKEDGASGLRTLGREGEYPVVQENGEIGDARRLLDVLKKEKKWKPLTDAPVQPQMLVGLSSKGEELALEVGIGTIELITGPFQTLVEMKRGHEALMKQVLDAARSQGLRILGRGIQPLSKIAPEIMSPKARYQVLHEVLGKAWLWFCVTASDQMHVSIRRSEVIEAVNFGNLIAPILVAFCGNSSIYHRKFRQTCSLREVRMGEILTEENRHGMILRPYKSVEDLIWDLSQKTCLVVRKNGKLENYGRPFTEYLEKNGPDLEAFLLHEHYIWHSARARSAHSTLEFRPACQQPWGEHMALPALATGLFEARDSVQTWLQDELGPNYWSRMRAFHHEAIHKGLAADPPLTDFYSTILGMARHGLEARKQGEEVFLSVHEERLRDRMNPAQSAAQILEQEGWEAFLRRSFVPFGSE